MKYTLPSEQIETARIVNPAERQHYVKPVNDPLYVITTISNPNRYYSRYKLYQAFEKMVNESGAILYTVELALRDRHFEVTAPDDPRDIQLRSPSECWQKERMINIGISRLPADWQYVAWIDADIRFARPDWATEAVHMLQHYKVIQMFHQAVDLGPDFDVLQDSTATSFIKSWADGVKLPYKENGKMEYPYHKDTWKKFHSGYAWAARRSALSDLGGLGDVAILGSADHHMCASLIGVVDATIDGRMSENYKKYWRTWQSRALKYVDRNVGNMSGAIFHYFHGRKFLRGYQSRWKLLVDNKFDPELDLKRDVQDLWQVTDHNWKLREDIKNYFSNLDGDSLQLN